MLDYFFSHKNVDGVSDIVVYINNLKAKISSNTFDKYDDIVLETEQIFEKIRQYAIEINDEKLANSQYITRQYLYYLINISRYYEHLSKKQYRQSWDYLQNALDIGRLLKRFAKKTNCYELDDLFNHLLAYEKLYPFEYFASTELIISESECTICGKSMQTLECEHIQGNLYWGEMAKRKVTKIDKMRAVALVTSPYDKRCVIYPEGVIDTEYFRKIDSFLELGLPYLEMFSINSEIVKKKNDRIRKKGRNELCSCGSGKKFKKCCGRELYYNHENITINRFGLIKLTPIT